MVVCYNGPAHNKKSDAKSDITVFLMETNRYTVWIYDEAKRIVDQSRMGKSELLDTWEPIDVL